MASIRYFVSNVDRAVAFYTQRLNFKLEQQFGPAIAITSGQGSSSSCRVHRVRVTGPVGRQILVEDTDGNVVELFEPAK